MKHAFKWIARIVGGLALLFLILGFAMFMIGSSKVGENYDLPEVALNISDDSTTLARGEYLARARGCTDCHASNLAGQEMFNAPPFRVVAPNLTSAGVLGDLTDGQLEQGIRHGVGGDGASLIIMPSQAFHGLADDDVAALISYMRSVPAVENEPGTTEIKALGRLLSAGPFDPASEVNLEPSPKSRPEEAPTAEYGAYVMGTFCSYCHGDRGEGVEVLPMPGSPPGPPLVASANWTIDQFKTAMRDGVTPAGRELDREFMPIAATTHMSDVELEALYAFLRGG